jgi:alkane 1-monooxygenase
MIIEFETVNYVEHYGLLRKVLADGNYERVDLKHSWNAPQAITNLIFFKLQRHSDHHENAYKPYQSLDSYADKSPELPYGYSISIIMSLVPYVWKKVIDPLAIAANDQMKPVFNKEHHLWVCGTLCFFSIVMTYICFVTFAPENEF